MKKNEPMMDKKTGLAYEVKENETSYKLMIEGHLVFSAEYNPLLEKWEVNSENPALHEKWDYRKEQKEEVIEKAVALLHPKIKKEIRESRTKEILAILSIATLVICAMLNMLRWLL